MINSEAPSACRKARARPHGGLVGRGTRRLFAHPEESELRCVEGEIAPAEEASLAGDDEAAEAHVSEPPRRHDNVHSAAARRRRGGGASSVPASPASSNWSRHSAVGRRRSQAASAADRLVTDQATSSKRRSPGPWPDASLSKLERRAASSPGGRLRASTYSGCRLHRGRAAAAAWSRTTVRPKPAGATRPQRRELVPQPECGEEPVAADQGAHSLSVFRPSMGRLRSVGGSAGELCAEHKLHNR